MVPLPLVLKQTERGVGYSVFCGVIAEHELEQSIPAVPVFMLGMSLSAWRSGMKGHRAGSAFAKVFLTLHSWREIKFFRGLDWAVIENWRRGKTFPQLSPFLHPHPKYRLWHLKS